MNEKNIPLSINDAQAKIRYFNYCGYDINALLVSFKDKRQVLSTWDGLRQVQVIANAYLSPLLSEETIKNYEEFENQFPLALGFSSQEIVYIGTGVTMDHLAVCERSYEELKVCCFATAGAKNNAMRMGTDLGNYTEHDRKFTFVPGTINILLLTNVPLTDGAMARAIMTVTEAKTAALQDLNFKSTYRPRYQATGTGSDNVLVVSGNGPETPIRSTSGHTKIGELMAFSTKIAVIEALKKHHG
jgi:adenosylcobinamide hydrolase